MCVPAIGMVAGLAGSMVSAMGAKSQADAQAAQMEYNAQVARINKRSTEQEYYSKQEDVGEEYRRLQGDQKVAAAKGGVDINHGSAARFIFDDTAFHEATKKSRLYIEGQSKATAYENQARDLEAQAKSTRKAGSIAAAGSFLSGIGGAFKSSASKGGLLINDGAYG